MLELIFSVLSGIGEEIVNQILLSLPSPVMIVIDSLITLVVTKALPFHEVTNMDPLEHLEMLSRWTLPSLLFAIFICCFDARIFNNASAYLLFEITANLLTIVFLTVIRLYFSRLLELTHPH
ncbi:hypothetical protein KCA1_1354 [Lactiplantibacillus pentosus KCA1]|nr:hypothetical protein [Lactiplantibacillus pentosus]EIW14037.1 hypothetical protein KCA1_1354 [Lactiplantibacillus pentosus KCA1]